MYWTTFGNYCVDVELGESRHVVRKALFSRLDFTAAEGATVKKLNKEHFPKFE